jgi:hypothetical protein
MKRWKDSPPAPSEERVSQLKATLCKMHYSLRPKGGQFEIVERYQSGRRMRQCRVVYSGSLAGCEAWLKGGPTPQRAVPAWKGIWH